MKILKYISLLIVSLLIYNIQANAATGEGICYEKTISTSDGYCALNYSISISHSLMTENVTLSNGDHAAYHNYYGVYAETGTNYQFYCIDNNLGTPSSFSYARQIDIDSSYDKAIAKAYQMYVNDSVYDGDYSAYLQDLNIAFRAITTKWGYDRGSTDYSGVVNYLEGKTSASPYLTGDSTHINIIKKYYFSALSTCTNCSFTAGVLKTSSAVSDFISSKGINANTSAVTTFNLKFTADTQNSTLTYDGNNFTKVIPVKISGLSAYSLYSGTNQYVNISSVACSDTNLTCKLENSSITSSTNLLNLANGADEITLNVVVSGNIKNFTAATSAKINITYKSYHIADPNALAVFKQSINTYYQRMIALVPSTPITADIDISVSLPSVCNATIENGKQIYKLGSTVVSETEYLEAGCCNVDSYYLTDKDATDYYEAYCQTGDEIHLESSCGQTCDDDSSDNALYSHSYVHQLKMGNSYTGSSILGIVNNAENGYKNGSYSTSEAVDEYLDTTLDNYEDEVYLASTTNGTSVAADNTYCNMYTSESDDLFYPTTATATSGRFFVFAQDENGEYTQPYIVGKITGTMHTDYSRWYSDYEDAITAEKNAYDAWQKAAALENAISKLTSCSAAGECGCCNPTTGEDGTPSCTGSCNTYYTGSNTKYASSGTYFDKSGKDLSYISASQSCGCGVNSRTSSPSPSASQLKTVYQKAKAYRETLEDYKEQCESKSTDLDDQWEYILEPDLTFYYQQTFSENGTSNSITTEVPMEISTEAVKYWPKVSTDVSTTATSGSKSSTTISDSYGGGSSKVSISTTVDKTEDYSVSKTQTLYYRPSIAYYSLVPSGKYVTSDQITSTTSIEIGYVFNVEITTYQGEYLTWFTINNIGHLMEEPTDDDDKNLSNTQNSMNKYLEDNYSEYTDTENGIDTSAFSSKCIYCDEEDLYERDCVSCDDTEFAPQYIYRTISTADLNPNNRTLGTNWSDAKGQAAEEQIEALGSSNSTYSEANLEYSFTLTTKDMQDIKDYNDTTNYSDWDLTCNSDGKECVSDFVTKWAEASGTEDIAENTRASKWKYFINGSWVTGTIKSLFSSKHYPDSDDETYINSNWP